jgi:hypothetical protein
LFDVLVNCLVDIRFNMSVRNKQSSDVDDNDIDRDFNPNKVAMAIHYYCTSREKVSWDKARNKFNVCSNTFNRYKSLWYVLRINELPKVAQLKRLRECILEHHIIIRGGNYYLSHAEEQHVLQWIITASERGKPFTGIQIRRMAAAIRIRGRKTTYDQINPPSSCTEETTPASSNVSNSESISVSETTRVANSSAPPTDISVITSDTNQISVNTTTHCLDASISPSHEQSANYVPKHTKSAEHALSRSP